MAMIKCPRCELNYMQDSEKVCTVCRREMHGDDERVETAGICPECGEHPVAPGEELCVFCLKEASRQEGIEEEEFTPENPTLLTAASAMDEIEIEIEDEVPIEEGLAEAEVKEEEEEIEGNDVSDAEEELFDDAAELEDGLEDEYDEDDDVDLDEDEDDVEEDNDK